MVTEELKKAYGDYLNTLNIHTLRNVARRVGVYKPTDGKKENLIERTIAVLMGMVAPVSPSNRGAPLKDDALDPKYMRELERIRGEFFLLGANEVCGNVMQVRSKDEERREYDQPLFMGILELMPNGCGYLRVDNCRITTGKDVFISSQNVRNWKLREGDYVVGYALMQSENNNPALIKVLSVNEKTEYADRNDFESFSACYPEEKIDLSAEANKLSLRYLDLFSPIGKGQRALIFSPSATDGGAILKDIAGAVQAKRNRGENLHLLNLLIDERPEEVTEFRCAGAGEFVYTTFDMESQEHLHAARLVFARAKRLAEMGEHVVLLLNSLTRLIRAADACCAVSKTLPCGLDASAFNFPRACLSEAVNLNGKGSVTIIAIVSADADNAVDQTVCAEFEKLCNSRIVLSRKLSDKRMFPAIDVQNSYTRREERLLRPQELNCSDFVRRYLLEDNGEKLYSLMSQSSDNAAFIQKIMNEL